MIWENDIETCKFSYVKRIASPGSMHDTGCSGLVHWDDPEGWDGEGGSGGGMVGGEWSELGKWAKRGQKNLSTFAWKIPWTEEPGRLQSMGSRRVGHD